MSEEELREEIKNWLSWGHAHDYDDIIREARADGWDEAVEHLHAIRAINPAEFDIGLASNPHRRELDDA